MLVQQPFPDVSTFPSVGIHLEGKLVVSIKCSLWDPCSRGAAQELQRWRPPGSGGALDCEKVVTLSSRHPRSLSSLFQTLHSQPANVHLLHCKHWLAGWVWSPTCTCILIGWTTAPCEFAVLSFPSPRKVEVRSLWLLMQIRPGVRSSFLSNWFGPLLASAWLLFQALFLRDYSETSKLGILNKKRQSVLKTLVFKSPFLIRSLAHFCSRILTQKWVWQ